MLTTGPTHNKLMRFEKQGGVPLHFNLVRTLWIHTVVVLFGQSLIISQVEVGQNLEQRGSRMTNPKGDRKQGSARTDLSLRITLSLRNAMRPVVPFSLHLMIDHLNHRHNNDLTDPVVLLLTLACRRNRHNHN